MSNPVGDYQFAGLGFIGLRFFEDGSQYVGYLYIEGDNALAISGATYTDATGVVTFNVSKSPAGVFDVQFTGSIILDMSGNVTAMAGTWTGRSILHVGPPIAATHDASRGISPIHPPPIVQAHGAWAAFNRQNIIP